MNHYEQKQEARRERMLARAQKADRVAEDRCNAATSVWRNLQGEPIKVGHHSEKRHRRILERADNDMRKGIEEHKKAERLRERAASVGLGGISSDDPDALVKVRRELDELTKRHERRKQINALWRKAGKPAPDDPKWHDAEFIASLGLSEAGANQLRLSMAQRWGYSWERVPFASYTLTNANKEIRRLTQRVAELEAKRGEEDVSVTHATTAGEVVYEEDTTDNRVRLIFNGKPSDDVRTLLKRHGFRWAWSVGAWQRQLNANGKGAARIVLEALRGQ